MLTLETESHTNFAQSNRIIVQIYFAALLQTIFFSSLFEVVNLHNMQWTHIVITSFNVEE